MLGAALTEEKDSVLYVDLLTSTDLEILKARKSGGVSGNNKPNAQVSGSNKRYVILTYSGKIKGAFVNRKSFIFESEFTFSSLKMKKSDPNMKLLLFTEKKMY